MPQAGGSNLRSSIMATLPTEQLSALQAANLDLLFGLTNKTLAGLQELAELNLKTMKATLAETQDNFQKAFAAKDMQDLGTRQGL